MDIYEEKYFVSLGMKRFGGGFIAALGQALDHADPNNTQRIKDSWPGYWNQYLKMGMKIEMK